MTGSFESGAARQRRALIEAVTRELEAAGASRPVCYEHAPDGIAFFVDRPVTLRRPFGDGTPQTAFRVGFAAATASNASADHKPSPPLLVDLDDRSVDLAAARIIRLVGPQRLVASWAGLLADAVLATKAVGCEVRRLSSASGEFAVLSLAELAGLSPRRAPLLLLALGASTEELDMALGLLGGRSDVALLTDRVCGAHLVLLAEEDGSIGVFVSPRSSATEVLEDRPPAVATRTARNGGPVTVAVLGSVVISGVESDLRRHPKLTELIAYLSVHPGGSLSRVWTAALWPERRVPQQTVANRLSEARRLLGCGADDLPRLRREGERHQLRDVTTDWEQFASLAAADRDPGDWRRALELVRGRPFEDLQEGQWAVLEGIVAEMEDAIAATALRLGADALGRRDPDEAIFAARQALRAAPFDERLHRLLMRAADQAGNRAAIEGVLQQLALVLEIDGDPLRAVHPETAALYQQLSGRDRPLIGR